MLSECLTMKMQPTIEKNVVVFELQRKGPVQDDCLSPNASGKVIITGNERSIILERSNSSLN